MWGKQVSAGSGSLLCWHLLPAGAGYSGLISVVASINPCTKRMYQDLSSVLEDVQVWVLLGYDFSQRSEINITRFGTRSDIAKDRALGVTPTWAGNGKRECSASSAVAKMNTAHDSVTTYPRGLWSYKEVPRGSEVTSEAKCPEQNLSVPFRRSDARTGRLDVQLRVPARTVAPRADDSPTVGSRRALPQSRPIGRFRSD
jgi:hypothetical protein